MSNRNKNNDCGYLEKMVIVPFSNVVNKSGVCVTQFLYGEIIKVYEEYNNGLRYCISTVDGYSGFINEEHFGDIVPSQTKITNISATVFSEKDIKSPPICTLPINSNINILDKDGDFIKTSLGYIHLKHIESKNNLLEIINSFIGTPYLWGGKTYCGIDCSGLIQIAFQAIGINIPRDSTPQSELINNSDWESVKTPDKGDLIFWNGHIGIMNDNEYIIHANATSMNVKKEKLKTVENRIKNIENKDISLILRYKGNLND